MEAFFVIVGLRELASLLQQWTDTEHARRLSGTVKSWNAQGKGLGYFDAAMLWPPVHRCLASSVYWLQKLAPALLVRLSGLRTGLDANVDRLSIQGVVSFCICAPR